MKFYLMQYKWYRKYKGGTYYYVFPIQLMVAPFWSDELITSCQTKLLKTETWITNQNK